MLDVFILVKKKETEYTPKYIGILKLEFDACAILTTNKSLM